MIEIEQHRLDNGLRVVLAPDATTAVTAVNLWYGVGSRNEPDGRTGFAHLFEHMMFQGSAHVAKNGHFQHIERVGGSANATTWFDRTNYFETLPSHYLDLALWLEADRMGWMLPAMTAEKLENQRQVVMNERRERYDNQPYGDWDERIQSLLFPPAHPYHHTVIGSMDDISAATLEDVRDFFRTYYLPNNAVLSICGGIDPAHALGRVDRYFGAIPPGPEPPPLPGDGHVPFSTGETLRADVVAAVPLPRIYMAARVPPFTSDEFYPGHVVSCCLGSGRSSRLYERVVRGGLGRSATCHLLPLTTGATIFLVIATGLPDTDPDALEETASGVLDGASTLAREEFERAVAGLETREVRDLQQVATRADLLSMYTTHFGTAARLNEDLRRLREVELEEAREWAREYLHGENRVVVRYLPEGRA